VRLMACCWAHMHTQGLGGQCCGLAWTATRLQSERLACCQLFYLIIHSSSFHVSIVWSSNLARPFQPATLFDMNSMIDAAYGTAEGAGQDLF